MKKAPERNLEAEGDGYLCAFIARESQRPPEGHGSPISRVIDYRGTIQRGLR